MASLAQRGSFVFKKNYAVLLLVGITLIVWGLLIISSVFFFKGIF